MAENSAVKKSKLSQREMGEWETGYKMTPQSQRSFLSSNPSQLSLLDISKQQNVS